MRRLLSLPLLVAAALPAAAQTCPRGSQRYTGTTGTVPVAACLRIEDGRRFGPDVVSAVVGQYWTTGRGPRRVFDLEGDNDAPGQLRLDETPVGAAAPTASVVLRKRLTAREVVWSGTLRNTDGRRIPMTLRRRR